MDRLVEAIEPISFDFNEICIDVVYGKNYKKSRKFSWNDTDRFWEWLETKIVK